MTGVAFIRLNRGLFALVDRADAVAVNRHTWTIKLRPRGTSYAVTFVTEEGRRRMISLHRFVWNLHQGPETPIVDHKRGFGLDYRWRQLRAAGYDQNAWNASAHRDAASGTKGVSWDKQRRRWRARVTHQGRRIEVARTTCKRDAVAAYRRAVRALHGRFARVA